MNAMFSWKFLLIKLFVVLIVVIKTSNALSSNPIEEVMAAATTLPLGSLCDFTSQCVADTACIAGRCRRSFCRQNYECSRGELCEYGKVDDDFRNACFPFVIGHQLKTDYCPGGGKPIANKGGYAEICDLEMPCLGRSICNPIYGICCSKLRACPYPMQPVLESDTHRPVICQLRGNLQLECPPNSQCEKTTGFCCASEKIDRQTKLPEKPESRVEIPRPGDRCEEGEECQGNSVCECDHGICHCQCLRTMGWTLDAENHLCKRTRRRLKERCKFDMDCQSAFSECSSGGCRCKEGFQKDLQGGCKPTSYRCVNHAEPLKYDGKVVSCITEKQPIDHENEIIERLDDFVLSSANSITRFKPRSKRENRDCPDHYYCVAIFDIAKQPNMHQGFCCPKPAPETPVCPVGNPHSSSQAPNYGCDECPWDHFCHSDQLSTRKKICCPKPCLSPEDIYLNGQCYPIAYHKDSCFASEQCVSKVFDKVEKPETYEFETAEMECIKGICECPNGYTFTDSSCKKLQCTVGLKSEPSMDTSGNLLRCKKSSDCNQGHICDPKLHACCRSSNHCPKDYVETGRTCELENSCETDEICVRARKGKKRICCKPEDE